MPENAYADARVDENTDQPVENISQNTVYQAQAESLVVEIDTFISTFESQKRALATDHQNEVVQAEHKYQSELAEADYAHNIKTARLRDELNAKNREKKDAAAAVRATITKLSDNTNYSADKAKQCFEIQKLALPGTSPSYRKTGQFKDKLKTAQDFENRAAKALKELKVAKYNQHNMNTTRLIFAFVGFVVALVAGIRNDSLILFIFLWASISSTGVAIALLIKDGVQTRMAELYAEILESKQIVDSCLREYLGGAEKETAEALRKAQSDFDRQYNEAVKAFEARKTEIESVFQQEKTDRTNRHEHEIARFFWAAREAAKDLKRKCYELYEATSFAGKRWTNGWEKWKPFSAKNDAPMPYSISIGSIRKKSSVYIDSQEYSFALPSLISINSGRGMLLKVPNHKKETAMTAVQSVMLRLLASFPPGMVRFTMFDPVGLGQNVAAFMPLGKYNDKLITSRAWSEPRHIEKELEKLTMHLENVIQMRLRNDHKTIEEYNQRSKVKEPYQIVVAMDFPTNFNEDSIRRLISIAENGARCGVYPIVVVDTDLLNKNTPYKFNLDNLAQYLEVFEFNNGTDAFFWKNKPLGDWYVELDDFNLEREKKLIDHILNEIGEKSESAMKVEVPFEELLAGENLKVENLWADRATTKDSIEVPLGPHNIEQMQKLVLGKETSHHAIIIGKTGSGKTNLMDVIITALALKYSPEEIEFYLIDLKKGVGFKPYSDIKLPHARVIAIDSEREFALSVLRGLIKEMNKRGDTFRKSSDSSRGLNIDSIKSYRDKTKEKMPRILLVVDEFQNLFLEEDQIANESTLILERLAREGRSFGIHILLGSQSLAGRSKLSSATLGQIGIRIALKCNESDARAIMAEDNPEARRLSRPGEAIYNDQNGLIEGNKHFQVAYFADDIRQKYLSLLAEKAGNYGKPVVFEGNELARLEECECLQNLIKGKSQPDKKRTEAWLGEPIELSDKPTVVRFRQQAGNNLLVVAKEESEGVGMMISAWLSLAFQKKPGEADFHFLNFSNSEEEWYDLIDEIGQFLPHRVEKIERKELSNVLKQLQAEIDARSDKGDGSSKGDGKSKYVMIFGLQRAKDLRPEDAYAYLGKDKEPSTAQIFAQILRDGPEVGIHVLACCDIVANVKRSLDRKTMNEFNFRVATQMTQDDSQFILDNSAASRLDRPHRAIFYDEDRPGYLEKFRPFAVSTDKRWWETISRNLKNFHNE
jgi:hypothetical protein